MSLHVVLTFDLDGQPPEDELQEIADRVESHIGEHVTVGDHDALPRVVVLAPGRAATAIQVVYEHDGDDEGECEADGRSVGALIEDESLECAPRLTDIFVGPASI